MEKTIKILIGVIIFFIILSFVSFETASVLGEVTVTIILPIIIGWYFGKKIIRYFKEKNKNEIKRKDN